MISIKKIVVLILMFLISSNVKALDYYTEYGEFTKWSTKYVEPSDLVYVEEKKLYKYYHEDIIGDYYKEGEEPSGYIIDKSNYKYGEYSEYTNLLPAIIDGRIIESIEVFEYLKMKPISYIFIYNINELNISEIDIKDSNGNNINFDINCTNCSDLFSFQLNNNYIYDYNLSGIDSNILISLRNPLYYDDITIDIYLYDDTDNIKSFDIAALSYDEDVILFSNFREFFKSINISDIKTYSLNNSNMIVTNTWYKSTDNTIDNYTKVNSKYLYRYKDIYYYYYKKKITYSGYLEEGDDYYNKRTDDYKTYYRYKKRTKIDSLTLDKKYNDMKTKYDTLNDTYKEAKKSISDLNKEVKTINDSYNKLSKTYDSLLTKYDKLESSYNNVSSENKEYINKFLKNEEEIKGLNTENNKLSKDMEELNLFYQNALIRLDDNISDYNKVIEEVNNSRIEVNDLSYKIETCESNLAIKEEEKNKMAKEFDNELLNLKMDEKNEEVRTIPILKIGNNYIYILPIIFLILILLLLFLLKNKKKN